MSSLFKFKKTVDLGGVEPPAPRWQPRQPSPVGPRYGKVYHSGLLLGILLATAIFFAIPATVQAATLYWVGNDGASIQTASNWKTTDPSGCGSGDSGSAPGASDTAVFDADCDSNTSIAASWSLQKLQMNSGYTPHQSALADDAGHAQVPHHLFQIGAGGTITQKD